MPHSLRPPPVSHSLRSPPVSHSLRPPPASGGSQRLRRIRSVSLPAGKPVPVTGANEQPLRLSPPTTPRPPTDLKLTSDALPPSQPLPVTRDPWDHLYPPTIISYLNGPHFSYDHTSTFNSDTRVTPESYEKLLTDVGFASEINIARSISFLQSLAPLNAEQRNQRLIVLSRDTSLVLELNFTPSPGRQLVFDALEIPVTRSVNTTVDPRRRRLLSLQILLVDAITDAFVQVGEWDQEKEGEPILAPSLVDFQAEQNVIDLRDGKVIVSFTLPCCFLDSTHRTGHYRICISLKLDGRQVGFQALPGIFAVVHMVEEIPKETISQQLLDQSARNYCCTTRSDSENYPSDIIGGCFERVFSLSLGLKRIRLRDISASGNHQYFRSLSPTKGQQLKYGIQLEYYHIERILTRACFDIAVLRKEHEFAINLMHPAPIQCLPVELLALIFSFIPDEYFDTLVRTCRRWEEIMLSIWAPLKLATWTSLDEVQAVLNRGNGLISITIDPSSDAMGPPVGSLEMPQYAAFMLAASTSISRWRTLDILSLPDPQQTNSFFGEQSQAIHIAPMNHLRSFNIPIYHDSSRFLDLLLPSVGASASLQLTDMCICSVQTMLFLAQPHCASVFNHLTSFKCTLPRMDNVVDILPHFQQLTIFNVSGLLFPTYAANVDLPLTKTVRQMSLRVVPIGWMDHREFLRLELCTIIAPPETDTIPVTSLPLCMKLYFEGPCFDGIKKFCIPSFCTLTLRSPQWSKSRGNHQLSRLWGAAPSDRVLCPTSLHLHLTCGSEQLLQALRLMPGLKQLVLELGHPTVLGSHFFIGFVPRFSQITSCKRAGKRKEYSPICPSLEVLGLKYQRWFRLGESNEMPVLVAMAHLDERDPKLKIWVEKGISGQEIDRTQVSTSTLSTLGILQLSNGEQPLSETVEETIAEEGIPGQERIQIDCTQVSASILSRLGILQLSNGEQPLSQVVEETIAASLATLYPMSIKFYHPDTMVHFSTSIYTCLFRQLRGFRLYVDVDQGVLFRALAYFEQLEEVYMKRLSPSLSQPHLPLLRTLKKLRLGTTTPSWMEGCIFVKLEELKIYRIAEKGHSRFQHVHMPVCKFASFPQSISSYLLGAFIMPQLHNLDLHDQPVGPIGGFYYPSTQQFRLRTASFSFVDSIALKDALAMQPELETLEIQELMFPSQLGRGLPELLDILVEPHNKSRFDHNNHGMRPPRPKLPLCPRLKKLKLVLVQMQMQAQVRVQQLELELEQVRVRVRGQMQRLVRRPREQRRVQDWVLELQLERKLVRELQQQQQDVCEWQRQREKQREVEWEREELELKVVSGEHQRTFEVRQCRKFMRRRTEMGYPLHCCQLTRGSYRTDIANELPGYLDTPDREFCSLGDIFASWESCNP